jgi:hypothetical protein
LIIKSKHEVRRKSIGISLHRLDQSFGLDTVERRKVDVEHHTMAAQRKDRSGDPRFGYGMLVVGVHRLRFVTSSIVNQAAAGATRDYSIHHELIVTQCRLGPCVPY